MPIANVAVNNVTGRITFKKSGFGNLQRAFATFRKRLFDVETNFVAQVSTYYRSLSDDVEFNSYENVVARREVR
jgi:archaellum component FlaF (FlaF/FlaG flagellin family)